MYPNNLTSLLMRYMEDNITPEESEELKMLLHITDDEELLLYLSYVWHNYEAKNTPDILVLESIYNNVKRKTRRLTLRHTFYKALKVAAVLLLPVIAAVSVYLFMSAEPKMRLDGKEMVVFAEKGQQASVILSDGTLVKLNADSHLSYRPSYGVHDRIVNLSGEAYFEVVKDTVKPFMVQTRHFDVEVLGTTFNIYSYEEDDVMEMTLISGQIRITTNSIPSKIVYLNPSEKALYNKSTGNLTVERTDKRFETAWMRGDVVFRSTPMEEVLQKIGRRYGVTIHLEDSLMKKDLFTGSFRCDHIHEVMKILQRHYAFTYSVAGDDIFIRPY